MLRGGGRPGTGVHVGAVLGALWFCLTGAMEVQVPEDPVVALVGTDTTLRCSFSPEPDFSLAQLNLIWQLTDTKQLVHSFTEGRDQGSAYANRTALFPDLLERAYEYVFPPRGPVGDCRTVHLPCGTAGGPGLCVLAKDQTEL
uniref:CD276 molecule n=1 Tax=Otolemur garnettii TaxID=30611 RepID=H0Y1A4_OTOGA